MCPNRSSDFEVFAPRPVVEPIKVTINAQNSGSEKCPLCLFAVQEAVTLLEDDKSAVSEKQKILSSSSLRRLSFLVFT